MDQEIQKEIKKVTVRMIRIAGISLLLGKGPSVRTRDKEVIVYWRVGGKERTAYLGTTRSEIVSIAVDIIKRRELPAGLQWWSMLRELQKREWIDIDNPETLIPVMSLIGALTLTARYQPWRVVKGPVRKLIDAVINGDKETIEKARDLMDDKRVKRAMQRLAEGRFEDEEVAEELREVLEALEAGDTLDEWIYEGGEEPKTEKTEA